MKEFIRRKNSKNKVGVRIKYIRSIIVVVLGPPTRPLPNHESIRIQIELRFASSDRVVPLPFGAPCTL